MASPSTAGRHKHHEHDHVSFAKGTSFEPCVVSVDEHNPEDVVIYLGLLQINHVYEVKCDIHSFLQGELSSEVESGGHFVSVASINKAASPDTTDGDRVQHSLTLHVTPRLEGNFFHHFHLCGKNKKGDTQRIRVSVDAKIFAKNQGTPLLKDHVRLLHRLPEADDSATTD